MQNNPKIVGLAPRAPSNLSDMSEHAYPADGKTAYWYLVDSAGDEPVIAEHQSEFSRVLYRLVCVFGTDSVHDESDIVQIPGGGDVIYMRVDGGQIPVSQWAFLVDSANI